MPLYRALLQRYAGGRLTLTSATPVTTSDVTGASTLYYTPCVSDLVSLYTGVAWRTYTFSELSLSLSGYTAAKPYDLFLYDNSGTLTLESAAWTNGTTRATAITQQDGTWVKSGDATWLYLGTIYTSGTGTTEDSTSKRFVWNQYHRQQRKMKVADSTNSWTYTTAAFRPWNNSTANRFGCVLGQPEAVVSVAGNGISSSNTSITIAGVGLDSTTVNSADVNTPGAASGYLTHQNFCYLGYPGIGYHYFQMLEYGGTGATFYGDAGATNYQSGMIGEVQA